MSAAPSVPVNLTERLAALAAMEEYRAWRRIDRNALPIHPCPDIARMENSPWVWSNRYQRWWWWTGSNRNHFDNKQWTHIHDPTGGDAPTVNPETEDCA